MVTIPTYKAIFLTFALFSTSFYALSSDVIPLEKLSKNAKPEQALNTLLTDNTKYTVVKFFMPGCGPCQAMGPVFLKVAQQASSTINFIEINVNKFGHLNGQYRIQSVPTFVFYAHGKEQGRLSGATTATVLNNKIKQYFKL
jgi:thioredoxin-like negative regulator of GroEL